jgi:hypothetical protein
VAEGVVGLSGADLRVVGELRRAMGRRAVVGAWFKQADADHADPRREHGGWLGWDDDGRLRAHVETSAYAAGDFRYFSSPGLIGRAFRGLAHYHFHAQDHDHAAFAGPGAGDVAFTEDTGLSSVVLTFVEQDALNVDLLLPGRRLIDLGVVRRPTGEAAEESQVQRVP